MRTSPLTRGLLLSASLFVCSATAGPLPGKAGATFAVHCYDVGASALNGKPGVVSVERGWSGGREVDRVVYDPQAVSLTQLENWLKQSGTYIGTLEQSMQREPEKEMIK